AVAAGLQRHRAPHDPQLQRPRGGGQELLHRTCAVGLGHGALVAVLEADEGEVLRQRRELGAARRRLLELLARLREVGGHVGAGGHLDRRNLHHLTPLPSLWGHSRCRANAAPLAPAPWPRRRTARAATATPPPPAASPPG